MSRQQGTTDPSSSKEELDGKDGNENEQASFDENEDEKARNEEIANQLLIDDVVKELIDMDRGWEWAEGQIIPNYKTKGAEATKPQQTMCEQTLDPAAVGQNHSSTP